MAEVLSQGEIDALLAAVSSGSVSTSGKKPTNDWIVYDLTSQEKIIRGKFAAFTGIHDRFCRALRVTLSNTFRKNVTVTPTSTDFLRFGEYIGNMLVPTSFNLYSMRGLNGTMMFIAGSKLTYALVDAYYGGPERPFSKTGGRDQFTKIETKMIRRICDIAAKDLMEAWAPNYPLQLDYLRTEANPAFVGAIHTADLVVVSNFEIELENLSGPLTCVLQLKALEPIQDHLKVDHREEERLGAELWKEHWLKEIMEIELDVRVELGHVQRSLTEIREFKKDDVLILNQDTVSPIPVYISELDKAAGVMGTYRGSRAIRLTELNLPPKKK